MHIELLEHSLQESNGVEIGIQGRNEAFLYSKKHVVDILLVYFVLLECALLLLQLVVVSLVLVPVEWVVGPPNNRNDEPKLAHIRFV